MAGALNISAGAVCGDSIALALQTVTTIFKIRIAVADNNRQAATLHNIDPLAGLQKLAGEQLLDPIKNAVLGAIGSFDEAFLTQQSRYLTDTTLDPQNTKEISDSNFFDVAFPPEMEVTSTGLVAPKTRRSQAPQESAGECASTPFLGMFGGVINTATSTLGAAAGSVAGVASISRGALSAASSIGAVLQSNLSTLSVGLGGVALGNLIAGFHTEARLLDRVIQLTDDIIETVEAIGTNNLMANHFILVLYAQKNLQAARTILKREEALLVANGKLREGAERERGQFFDSVLLNTGFASSELADGYALEDADLYMNRAEDLLGGVDVFPSLGGFSKMAKLIALLAELKGIRKILETLDRETAVIIANVLSFETELKTNFSVTNYFGGTIHRIQCELQKIIAQMDEAMRKDDLITYVTMEKQWELQIKLLRGFMQLSLKRPAEVLDEAFDTSFMKDFLSGLSQVTDPPTNPPIASLEGVLNAIDTFADAATIFLRREGNVFALQILQDELKSEIVLAEHRRTEYESVLSKYEDLKGVGTALRLAQEVVAAASQVRALSGVAKNLEAVDWAGVFSSDGPFTTSLDGIAAVALSGARDCCEDVLTSAEGLVSGDAALSRGAVNLLDDLLDFLVDGAREDALEDEVSGEYKDRELAFYLKDAQTVNTMVTSLDSVRNAPCFKA